MSDRRTETVMDAATALASLVSNKAGERSRSISPQGPKDDGASAIASAIKPEETVNKQPQPPLPATTNPMLNNIGPNSNLSVAPNNGTSSAASRAKSTKFPIKVRYLSLVVHQPLLESTVLRLQVIEDMLTVGW